MSSNNQNLFQLQGSQQPKKRPSAPTHDSILEAFRDLGSGVKKSVANDVVGKTASDVFGSLLGSSPRSGDTRPRNPFERPVPPFMREKPQPVQRPEILSPQRVSQEQERTRQQLEAVRSELVALAKSVGQLNQDIEKAIMEVPVEPGVYHLNFLERLKSIIMLIRQKVDDSRSWMSLSSEKKKKKGYWGSYKKHGTKFGLSSERTVSTQTG